MDSSLQKLMEQYHLESVILDLAGKIYFAKLMR